MCVHAHPDDESSKGAAAMARYVAEGVDVVVVTLTDGGRGDILNPAMDAPDVRADIVAVRRRELAAACAILGVRSVWLGFPDSGWVDPDAAEPPPLLEGCFAALPLESTAAALADVMRRERPHVVVTYDENGGYPHPDHVACHRVTMAAWEVCPEARKLYYVHGFHKAKVAALHEALVAREIDSPYTEWIANWVDKPEDRDRVTTRVHCAEFFAQRTEALLAHATQVDPTGRWMTTPLDIQESVWPTEDFELAASRVPTSVPEDDLFAGLR